MKDLLKYPGPGQYETKPSLNKEGSYFISRFQSSFSRKFGREQRNSITKSRTISTPGPGTYRSPSEFGYYEAKEALRMGTTIDIKRSRTSFVMQRTIRSKSANTTSNKNNPKDEKK